MKKPLQKLTRHDDVFQFFLKRSLLVVLIAATFALVWGQNVRGHADLLLVPLIVCGAGGRLVLLRLKPKTLHFYGTRLQLMPEGYAESDALLTEMEIPYYEHIANKHKQTSERTADRKQAQLTI